MIRVDWLPLKGAGRALDEIPVVFKKNFQVGVIPFCRGRGPGPVNTAGYGIFAFATAHAAYPAETLLFDRSRLGFRADMLRAACTVTAAKCMAPGDQGNGLFVIHGHAGKSFANVFPGSENIRFTVWSFRVYVNQTHLHSSKRVFKIPFT